MAIGDVYAVEAATDVYYLDTGMYDTPEFGSVYLLDFDRPAVVDTGIGTNYDLLRDALDEVGIGPADLEAIVATHVHLDHAGGAGFLARDYPNADVYVHEIGAPHLVDPSRLVEGTKRAVGEQWQFYVEPEPVPAERVVELADGDVVDLGNRRLDVHHAPGHAPHQCVFFDPDDRAAYTADAAGIYVQSRDSLQPTTPPPNFDFEANLADLDLLAGLEPEVLLYAHYGPGRRPPGDLLADYRAVLTDWVDAIETQWRATGDDDAVVAYFVDRENVSDIWGETKATAETEMNVRGVLRYLKTHES